MRWKNIVRETLTPKLKADLEEFFDFLETNPEKLGKFCCLTQEARLHALNQNREFMDFNEWIEVLKVLKIPFPFKQHGTWYALPTHEDQVYKLMNKNLIKGGKHSRYSVLFAKKGSAPIYHMKNKTVEELENKYYTKETRFFLTDGIEKEKEEEE
ncbi:MAG: hypothetical protein ACFFDF_23520 [Candidatus Odinarchaeota archaeon]